MAIKGEIISTGYWNECVAIDEETGEKTFQTCSIYSIASDRELEDGTNLQQLKDQLDIENQHFVFDYKDGLYGYNTDVNRDASTFCSFGVNQLKFNLQSTLRTANYGNSDVGFDNANNNYIILPMSIIESVSIGGGVSDYVYYPDGNEIVTHRIVATQQGLTNKIIKSTSNNMETLTLNPDDFEDIKEYPYLKLEIQVDVNYTGYYVASSSITVNLK